MITSLGNGMPQLSAAMSSSTARTPYCETRLLSVAVKFAQRNERPPALALQGSYKHVLPAVQ